MRVYFCGSRGSTPVVLFRHDPWRADDEPGEIAAACSGAGVKVIAAFDGMELDVP